MLDQVVIEVLSEFNRNYPNDLDRMQIYLCILPALIGYGYKHLIQQYLEDDIALNMAFGLLLK